MIKKNIAIPDINKSHPLKNAGMFLLLTYKIAVTALEKNTIDNNRVIPIKKNNNVFIFLGF